MTRWLITGADGFVAGHLLPHLKEAEPDGEIFAMVWNGSPRESWPEPDERLAVLPGELTDADGIASIVRESSPDYILHLAAASSVARSWQDPEPAYRANILGQLHLLEAARSLERPPRVVVASSAEIYGRDGHDGRPISESAPLRPLSPYAVTKAAQDLQAFQYWAGFGLETIRLRLFNHTGPGRPDHFVASSFARQLAEIERGLREPALMVGNLDVARDFTDVRDVVHAWRLAALHGPPGSVFNVCSGHPTTIRSMLDMLLALVDREVEVRVDPSLLRSGEIEVLYGDRSLFTEMTGWEPRNPLKRTLEDLLDWWRHRVGNGVSMREDH